MHLNIISLRMLNLHRKFPRTDLQELGHKIKEDVEKITSESRNGF